MRAPDLDTLMHRLLGPANHSPLILPVIDVPNKTVRFLFPPAVLLTEDVRSPLPTEALLTEVFWGTVTSDGQTVTLLIQLSRDSWVSESGINLRNAKLYRHSLTDLLLGTRCLK